MKHAVSVAVSLATGAAAFYAVLLLREHGQLTGLVGALVAASAALCLPTSPHLSGRLLLTGTAVLGWNQVVWWARWDIDRVSLLLAVLVGSAVAVLVYLRSTPQAPQWSVLPQVHWVDSLPCLVLLAGLVGMGATLRQTRPIEALGHLLPAWDNAGHFWMFTMILRHGATIDALPPPSRGETWHYSHYPEGFHATVASLAQLLWPQTSWSTEDLLLSFEPAVALVVLAGVTVLAAGLTSLPAARERWDVTFPLVGLLAGAYLFGLGHVLVSWGFASFLLSCSLVGCALFVALQWTGIRQTSALVAMGGAAVGVAHGWILLLTLMLPVGLALALPLGSGWVGSRARWAAAAGVVVATAYGVYRATKIVITNPDGDLLSTPGGILPPSPWGLLALLMTLVALFFVTRSWGAIAGRASIGRRRARVTMLMLPVAAVVATYLAVIQIRANGHVSYYFWKYLCGAELVLLVLAAGTVATHLGPEVRLARKRSVVVAPLAITALTVGAAMAGVFMGTGSTGAAAAPHRAGPSTWHSFATELMRSPQNTEREPGTAMFIASPGPLDTMNGALWHVALEGEWTSTAEAQAEQLQGLHLTYQELADLAASWLEANSGTLLVPPEVHDLLMARPEMRSHGGRVAPW